MAMIPNNTSMNYRLDNGFQGKFCCYAESPEEAVMKLKKWYRKKDEKKIHYITGWDFLFADLFEINTEVKEEKTEPAEGHKPATVPLDTVPAVVKYEPVPLWVKAGVLAAMTLSLASIIIGGVALWI